MFILLNKCFGGFGFSEDFLKEYPEYKNDKRDWEEISFRTDMELMNKVKYFGIHRASDYYSNLSIVSIPNDVTDWRMKEDDGYEYIEYVKDGKIFDA